MLLLFYYSLRDIVLAGSGSGAILADVPAAVSGQSPGRRDASAEVAGLVGAPGSVGVVTGAGLCGSSGAGTGIAGVGRASVRVGVAGVITGSGLGSPVERQIGYRAVNGIPGDDFGIRVIRDVAAARAEVAALPCDFVRGVRVAYSISNISANNTLFGSGDDHCVFIAGKYVAYAYLVEVCMHSDGCGLAEDIIVGQSCPSCALGARSGMAGCLIVNLCGNFGSDGCVQRSARIFGHELVEHGQHVCLGDGLPVGQFTGGIGTGASGVGTRVGAARASGISGACASASGISGAGRGLSGIVRAGCAGIGRGSVLGHSVNHHGALAAVHRNIAFEASVTVSADDAQGIHGLDGVLVLAGNTFIIRNLRLCGGFLSVGRREALLGHDVDHELGHVVSGDSAVHDAGVAERVLEARVGQDARGGQGLGVGSKPSAFVGVRVVLLDLVGVKGPGQHDAELGPGHAVSGPEGSVGIAAHDAFSGGPENRVVKAVAGGDVGEPGYQGNLVLDLGILSLSLTGDHDGIYHGFYGLLVFLRKLAQVGKLVASVPVGEHGRDGLQVGTGIVNLGRKRGNCQSHHHDDAEQGRQQAANGLVAAHKLPSSLSFIRVCRFLLVRIIACRRLRRWLAFSLSFCSP